MGYKGPTGTTTPLVGTNESRNNTSCQSTEDRPFDLSAGSDEFLWQTVDSWTSVYEIQKPLTDTPTAS
jgi:hypothetical protein